MTSTTILLAALLGLGLSASTGLNTFLPLLLFSAAARVHLAGITLSDKFEWLASDAAIIGLIIASIVEIVGDKVPAVDHFLDSIGTFMRPLAASLGTAAALAGVNVDPTVAAIAGIIIGTPTSLGLHSLKAGTRVVSSGATLGCANPLLSLIEDVVSFALTVIALFAPILVPVALAALVFVLWRIVKRLRRPPEPTAL